MYVSAERADIVFVQPHFDDVALSCGGTVAACAAVGRPLIVTIFAGRPQNRPGGFARFQHERWGLADVDAVSQRRDEDRRALASLGCTVEGRWLDFLDAIYRSDEYSSDEVLFGEPMASDQKLVGEIAASLEALGDRFILPLGVGNHVDHQLVFRAGAFLRDAGRVVRFYADMPYALDHSALRERLEALGDPRPGYRLITSEEFNRRWDAIQCYESQLAVIFRHFEDPRKQLEQFGRREVDPQPVELFWSLDRLEGQTA